RFAAVTRTPGVVGGDRQPPRAGVPGARRQRRVGAPRLATGACRQGGSGRRRRPRGGGPASSGRVRRGADRRPTAAGPAHRRCRTAEAVRCLAAAFRGAALRRSARSEVAGRRAAPRTGRMIIPATGAHVAVLAAIHAAAFPPREAWGEDAFSLHLAL